MASTSIQSTVEAPTTDIELLERLKASLTSPQQQLFVDSFWTTLQCDEEREMVIDLDDACQFIGALKGNVKKMLLKHFKEGQDFACNIYKQNGSFCKNYKNLPGGRPTEQVMMTPDTFKELCMLANTAKGKEVRGYYIKMEKVLKAYLREKLAERTASEARLLMEKAEAEARLEEELEKQKERKYVEVPKVDSTYVAIQGAEVKTGRHKVGKTLDKKSRESNFGTANARGMKMIHVRETRFARAIKDRTHNGAIVEAIVAAVMKRYHYNKEHYMCDVEHTINVIDVAAIVIDTLASCFDSISRDEMFDKVIENLEAVRGEEASEATEADAEAQDEAVEEVEQDSVATFLSSVCVIRPDLKVSAEALYDAFALQTGQAENRKKWFGGQMKRRGFVGKTIRLNESASPCWGYEGIALKVED